MASARAPALAVGTETVPVVAALALVIAAVLFIYGDTFLSLVSVWQQSDTFAHCFLIAPICAFLIWQRRGELARAPWRVSAAGVAAIAVLSLGWLVATAADVQVGQHLTAVMLLPAAVVAMLGVKASREITFPLAYLLFAVPFGEGLIPILMDFTASFTVVALRLTGMPVLREGLYFSIPSGDFEIAKACSGIRYLIACSALGVLYAYFAYRSAAKRAVFIAVSIVAPIVANGVRAYLIVMIAHLSDMKLAVGVDHLIYGWLFFGVLIALLFWIGGRFADSVDGPQRPLAAEFAALRSSRAALAGTGALVIGLAAAAPYLAARAESADAPVAAALPVLVAPWQGPESVSIAWRGSAPAGAREASAAYGSAPESIELAILRFGRGAGDVEMVGAVPALVETSIAPILEVRGASVRVEAAEFAVRELVLRADRGLRVVWYWYRIGGKPVAADWHAKALEAWNVLAVGRMDASLVLVSAQGADARGARETLQGFLGEAWPHIERCLDAAAGCAEAPR